MDRKRDSQRSKVYAWERSIPGLQQRAGTMSMDECETMVKRVWRGERGRYGKAHLAHPRVEVGRNGGVAHGETSIGLGRWARQPVVVLHELAHCLTYDRHHREAHGPRFVGVAIGLYCRHLGADRDELLAAAAERGVKVNLRAIGAVPNLGWHRKALRALELLGGQADHDIELAMAMGCNYRVARGALLTLLRQGRVKFKGRKIHLVPVADVGPTFDKVPA